ncbi:MAG: hypothetical protein AAF581_23425 [Planctomycetota bacterium]
MKRTRAVGSPASALRNGEKLRTLSVGAGKQRKLLSQTQSRESSRELVNSRR